MLKIKNPIIPGFYPDPSIIRLDGDFYIVNSSFEYFPSIPIWHSCDLQNWRQIGNVVDRAEQGLDLSRVAPSGGVQAATIRHHGGVFYVTSTRINPEWPKLDNHFIVTATDINGPWSECHYIQDAPGIDSSLFFDGDQAYFLANRSKIDGDETSAEIWMSEIDLESFTLVGEKFTLWDGTGGIFPEGPRMYKRNGFYYLLIAEGGTLHNHTTSIARSEKVTGPYISSPRNPILTHKHLAREYPIQNVGHADMVELKDGSWWGVALGSRPRGGFYDGGNVNYSFGGYYRNLGRETFLFPITWPADDLSPLFTPEKGRIVDSYQAPALSESVQEDVPIDFSEESLKIKWVTIRNKVRTHFSRSSTGDLTLKLQERIEDSFLGFRQNSWNFEASATLDVSQLAEGDSVSLAAYIKEGSCLSLTICRSGGTYQATVQSASGSQRAATTNFDSSSINVKLQGIDQEYRFSCPGIGFTHTLDGREISCDMNDAHTGVMIAFIGSSNLGTKIKISSFNYRVD